MDGTDPLPGAALDDEFFIKTMVLEAQVEAQSKANTKPAIELQPGSLLRDRYVLKEQVGNGSMGVVFKAHDRHMTDATGGEALVAIKLLAPQLAHIPNAFRALQQEAAKGRYLTHPGIVRFIDLDREGQTYFIVMEWLNGESLSDVIERNLLPNNPARVLDIVRQVGTALQYAHERGVIHADIKPGNVMLLPDGTTKLIDFGIARVRQLGITNPQDPVVVEAATAAYSSMQVLTGEEPVASDDVFSLACLTYRLLAGHRAFGPRNAAEAANAGMEPQRPAHLSDSQWQALRRALSYSRVARQQTPMDFVSEMDVARRSGSDTPGKQTASVAEPLVIPADAVLARRFDIQRSRWPLLLLLLLLVGAAALWFRPALLISGIESVESFVADVQQRANRPDSTRDAAAFDEDGSAAAISAAAAPATPAPASANLGQAEPAVAAAAPASPTQNTFPAASIDDEVAEDMSSMPPEIPDGPQRLVLAGVGRSAASITVSVHEDGQAATVELERQTGLSEPLLVRVDEVGFSGRRSPGNAGEYILSDDGVISFEAGQRNASITISAVSNTARESDRQVMLRLRDYYDAESVLGDIQLRLLDDDQRAFEANFPVNSISFANSRAIVRERDPAAQIEVLRYNPDDSALVVVYYVRDESATEGEDYFVPTNRVITFGPGQRHARLLISLVQETVQEGDERFMVELDQVVPNENMIDSVSVIIRDDDSFAE
ncbi:MAG: protein kinase [Woeseia sp.]